LGRTFSCGAIREATGKTKRARWDAHVVGQME
jgi:hypothetical protein